MQIIYGRNSVEAYLTYAPNDIQRLILAKGLTVQVSDQLQKRAAALKLPCHYMDKQEIEQLVGRVAVHQGVLAEVCDFQYGDLQAILHRTLKRQDKVPLFVLLDQVQDPGNLGAILRTIDCVGEVDALIVTKHNSAKINATTVKTSTGAALVVPIVQVTNAKSTLQLLKKSGIWVSCLDMEGAAEYRKADYNLPLCVVIGGEDAGIRSLIKKESDFNVYIPMKSKVVNSLNVSVATSLLLYEIMQQRQR